MNAVKLLDQPIAIIFVLIALFGCTSSVNSSQKASIALWEYKENFDTSFTRDSIRKQDVKLTESFIELYREKSHKNRFNKLRFHKILVDTNKKFRFYLFDIEHVNHDQAVFKINSENELVDNYLIVSPW